MLFTSIILILISILITSIVFITVCWGVSYSMNNDEKPSVKNYVSYRVFKKELLSRIDMNSIAEYTNTWPGSIIGNGIFIHASIFCICGEHYYFITPVGYVRAIILVRKITKVKSKKHIRL